MKITNNKMLHSYCGLLNKCHSSGLQISNLNGMLRAPAKSTHTCSLYKSGLWLPHTTDTQLQHHFHKHGELCCHLSSMEFKTISSRLLCWDQQLHLVSSDLHKMSSSKNLLPFDVSHMDLGVWSLLLFLSLRQKNLTNEEPWTSQEPPSSPLLRLSSPSEGFPVEALLTSLTLCCVHRQPPRLRVWPTLLWQ